MSPAWNALFVRAFKPTICFNCERTSLKSIGSLSLEAPVFFNPVLKLLTSLSVTFFTMVSAFRLIMPATSTSISVSPSFTIPSLMFNNRSCVLLVAALMVTELSPGSSANSKTSFPEGSNVRSISSYEYPSISSVSSFGSKSSTMSSPWDTDALFTNLKIS